MARTTPESGELFETLVILLRKVGGRVDEMVRSALTPLDIAPREYALLSLLAAEGPMSQQVASRAIGVDRTSMVGLVDRLEAGELVKREPHPTDRRAYQLVLSGAGEKRRKQALRALMQAESQMLGRVSDKELRRMLRSLADLADGETERD